MIDRCGSISRTDNNKTEQFMMKKFWKREDELHVLMFVNLDDWQYFKSMCRGKG